MKILLPVLLSFSSALSFGQPCTQTQLPDFIDNWPNGATILDIVGRVNTEAVGPFSLTDMNRAAPNSTYISNTVYIDDDIGSAALFASGGNGTRIIKNGIPVNVSTNVGPGDTIALSTYLADTPITVYLCVDEATVEWRLTPAEIEPLESPIGGPPASTTGELSVNEVGAAIYSIPLTVSPGTGGMQPDISLLYNSFAPNGLMGMGWSISGLSKITRGPANQARDGFIDGVDFDDNDRFFLDGEALIAIDGNYGENLTEYRTEHETFSRIVSYAREGNGPRQFRVWTKSGLIIEYGFSGTSRVAAHGRADILVWAVNRISDRSGNYMDFLYYKDPDSSAYRPVTIEYTGNSTAGLEPYAEVRFLYEDRGDVVTRHTSGSAIIEDKRLRAIRTEMDGRLVRRYELEYTEEPSTGRSLMSAIRECGTDGDCFTTTWLEWITGTEGFADMGAWATNAYSSFDDKPELVFNIELDGDGRVDTLLGPDIDGKWYALLNKGDRFEDDGFWVSGAYADWRSREERIRPIDANGDGLGDVLLGPDSSGDWFLLRNTGSGFVNEGAWITGLYGNWSGEPRRIRNTDLDGDALPDILLGPDSSGRWFVLRNTRDGFVDEGIWFTGYSNWRGSPEDIRNVDMTGDGRADMLIGPDGSGRYFVMESTGTGFIDHGAWITGAHGNWNAGRVRLADATGDGLPDVVLGPGTSGAWYVLINTGTSLVDDGVWLSGAYGNWSSHVIRVRNADINGDGLVDVVIGPTSSGDWYLLRSEGDRFVDEGVWQTGLYGAWSNRAERMRNIDATGDGTADIVLGPDANGNWYVAGSQFRGNGRLARVTSRQGRETQLTYAPLTQENVYDSAGNATYPIRDYTAPLWVVSDLETRIGGMDQLHFLYKYHGAKIDLTGRGFLGFTRVTMIDGNTGARTITSYFSDHRYRGMPLRIRQYAAGAELISEINNELGLVTLDGGRTFSYIESSETISYELDGTETTRTTTSNQIDEFGNVVQVDVVYAEGHAETTINGFRNDTDSWLIGLMTGTTVLKEAPGYPVETQTSIFDYDPDTGLMINGTTEPGHPELELVRTYRHDVFGNVIETGLRGPQTLTRSRWRTYEDKGRFPIQETNAAGHEEDRSFDPLLGNVLTHTGPNGLTTELEYDTYGRLVRQVFPDGTEALTDYRDCTGICPPDASYYVQKRKSGGAREQVFFDALGREVRKAIAGFDGRMIYVDTERNRIGETVRVSLPYFAGEERAWTEIEYDAIGRKTVIASPDDRDAAITYDHFMTTTINPEGQVRSKMVNSLGQVVYSGDDDLSIAEYDYDSAGNRVRVTDANGNVTQMGYDIRGHQISIDDPDTGLTEFRYNGIGEIVYQEDARGNAFSFEYDLLGRMVRRSAPNGDETLWVYDDGHMAEGKLSAVLGSDGVSRYFSYDDLGRLSETTTVIDGRPYTLTRSYDQYGRLETITYPNTVSVRYSYNEHGYPTTVRRDDFGGVLWRAVAVNARGQLEEFRLGNGLVTRRQYDPTTGFLHGIETGENGGTEIQDLSYQWDALGNLIERRENHGGAHIERFDYDALNRMTEAHVLGQDPVNVGYSRIGNITFKTDVGLYHYGEGGAGPHALTSITGERNNTFTYDAVGNRTTSQGGSITYTSFNKPRQIEKGAHTINFRYGPELRRISRLDTGPEGTRHKIYIGGSFEVETGPTGRVRETCYVRASGETVAMLVVTDNAAVRPEYTHHDHLGSPHVVTDNRGEELERLSFDAWGKRRNSDWTPIETADLTSILGYGFTGHEQLDGVELIHMGGRVYDPVVGRFVNPDPFIQFPEEPQNHNRYSYTLNNPLSYTDPTGFFLGGLFDAIGDFFEDVIDFVKDNWITGVSLVVGVVTGGLGASLGAALGNAIGVGAELLATVGGALGHGFGSAFSGTLLSGGSFGDALQAGFKSGGLAALSAGVLYGIDSILPGWLGTADVVREVKGQTILSPAERIGHQISRITLRATARGAIGRLSDRDFKKSALISVASDSLQWYRDYVVDKAIRSGGLVVEDENGGFRPLTDEEKANVARIYGSVSSTLTPPSQPAAPKYLGLPYSINGGDANQFGYPITAAMLEKGIPRWYEGSTISNIAVQFGPFMHTTSLFHDAIMHGHNDPVRNFGTMIPAYATEVAILYPEYQDQVSAIPD